MAAPTTAARVKKALANPEPSTHGPSRHVALRRPSVANGPLRTWLDLLLAPPVAIDTREPQVGALKKGLLRPRLSAIIMSSRLPASHPDCRAVLIQIVALYTTRPLEGLRINERSGDVASIFVDAAWDFALRRLWAALWL